MTTVTSTVTTGSLGETGIPKHLVYEGTIAGIRSQKEIAPDQNLGIKVYETADDDGNLEPFFLRIELEDIINLVNYRDTYYFEGNNGDCLLHKFVNPHPSAAKKRGRDFNTGKLEKHMPQLLEILDSPKLPPRLALHPAIKKLMQRDRATETQRYSGKTETPSLFGYSVPILGIEKTTNLASNHSLEIRIYEPVMDTNGSIIEPFFLRVELKEVKDGTPYNDIFHFDGYDGKCLLHRFTNPNPNTSVKKGHDFSTEKLERYMPQLLEILDSPTLSKRLTSHPAIGRIKKGDYAIF